MSGTVTMEVRSRVAVLWIDNPPVHALSEGVRRGLAHALADADVRPDIDRILLLTRGRTFVSGADIKEFGKQSDAPKVAEVIEMVATAGKPVICAIHGAALGGGLELALACSHRLATPSARLGLPEVKLGLIPGAGGTQRLPRIVGPVKALSMLVSGEPVDAREAAAIGLVDEIVTDAGEAAIARTIAWSGLARQPAVQAPATAPADIDVILDDWRRSAAETYPGFVAPQSCIEAVAAACTMPLDRGLAREGELFRSLLGGPESKALVHLFFGEREVSRQPAMPGAPRPRTVERVVIVDTGRPISDRQRTDLAAADVVVILPCGPTETDAWRLKEAIGLAGPDAVIAAVGGPPSFSTGTPWQDRALCIDAPKGIENARILEIGHGPHTAPDVAGCATALGRRLNALAIVPARPGILLGPRLVRPYLAEAGALAATGVAPARLDAALEAFGMECGPFALAARLGMTIPRPDMVPGEDVSDEILVERCVLSLINGMAKMLGAGEARRAVDLDVLAVMGYGFPRRLGGPMFHADRLGLDHVLSSLNRYREKHGEAWNPASLIVELAATGGLLSKFVAPPPVPSLVL